MASELYHQLAELRGQEVINSCGFQLGLAQNATVITRASAVHLVLPDQEEILTANLGFRSESILSICRIILTAN